MSASLDSDPSILITTLAMRKKNSSNTGWVSRCIALTSAGDIVQLPSSVGTIKPGKEVLKLQGTRTLLSLFEQSPRGTTSSNVRILDKSKTCEFSIDATTRELRLRAPTPEIKQAWLKAFRECIANLCKQAEPCDSPIGGGKRRGKKGKSPKAQAPVPVSPVKRHSSPNVVPLSSVRVKNVQFDFEEDRSVTVAAETGKPLPPEDDTVVEEDDDEATDADAEEDSAETLARRVRVKFGLVTVLTFALGVAALAGAVVLGESLLPETAATSADAGAAAAEKAASGKRGGAPRPLTGAAKYAEAGAPALLVSAYEHVEARFAAAWGPLPAAPAEALAEKKAELAAVGDAIAQMERRIKAALAADPTVKEGAVKVPLGVEAVLARAQVTKEAIADEHKTTVLQWLKTRHADIKAALKLMRALAQPTVRIADLPADVLAEHEARVHALTEQVAKLEAAVELAAKGDVGKVSADLLKAEPGAVYEQEPPAPEDVLAGKLKAARAALEVEEEESVVAQALQPMQHPDALSEAEFTALRAQELSLRGQIENALKHQAAAQAEEERAARRQARVQRYNDGMAIAGGVGALLAAIACPLFVFRDLVVSVLAAAFGLKLATGGAIVAGAGVVIAATGSVAFPLAGLLALCGAVVAAVIVCGDDVDQVIDLDEMASLKRQLFPPAPARAPSTAAKKTLKPSAKQPQVARSVPSSPQKHHHVRAPTVEEQRAPVAPPRRPSRPAVTPIVASAGAGAGAGAGASAVGGLVSANPANVNVAALKYPVLAPTARQQAFISILEAKFPHLLELADYHYAEGDWKSLGTFDDVQVQENVRGIESAEEGNATLLCRGVRTMPVCPDKMMALLWQTVTKPEYDMMTESVKTLEHINNHVKIERQVYRGFGVCNPRYITIAAGWQRIVFDNEGAEFSSRYYAGDTLSLDNAWQYRGIKLLGLYDQLPAGANGARTPPAHLQELAGEALPTHNAEGYEYTRDGFAMLAMSIDDYTGPDGTAEAVDKSFIEAKLKVAGFFIRGVKMRKDTKKGGLWVSGAAAPDGEHIYGCEVVGMGAVDLGGKMPQWLRGQVARKQPLLLSAGVRLLQKKDKKTKKMFIDGLDDSFLHA